MLQTECTPQLRGTTRRPDDQFYVHAKTVAQADRAVKRFDGQADTWRNRTVDSADMINFMELGSKLKDLRAKRRAGDRKLAAEVVADAVGISRSHLAEIENGTGAPSLLTLGALATYFDVSVGYLLGEVPGGLSATSPANGGNAPDQLEHAALLEMWDELYEHERRLSLRIIKGLVLTRGQPDVA